jgi:hypothetical protein
MDILDCATNVHSHGGLNIEHPDLSIYDEGDVVLVIKFEIYFDFIFMLFLFLIGLNP